MISASTVASWRDQLVVEVDTQSRSRGPQPAARKRRRLAHVGQQPDHDVPRASTLQRLYAVDQTAGGNLRGGRTDDTPLEKVLPPPVM